MRELEGFLDDPRMPRFGHRTVVRPMPPGWACTYHPAATQVVIGVIDPEGDRPGGRQITCLACVWAAQRYVGGIGAFFQQGPTTIFVSEEDVR